MATALHILQASRKESLFNVDRLEAARAGLANEIDGTNRTINSLKEQIEDVEKAIVMLGGELGQGE